MENNDYTQQDITFKIAERFEDDVEIKFSGSNTLLNVYSVEAVLAAYIENLGLKLVIEDMAKFECGTKPTDGDLPF
jgi:hypothetical protein